MVKPTWFERDLLVLRAIVELDEESVTGYLGDAAIAAKAGLDVVTVRQSLKALAHNDPPFGQIEMASFAGDWEVQKVTGHARRTVEQWPTPATEVDRLIAALTSALEEAVDDAPDEDSKGKVRAMLDSFQKLPASVMGSLATAAALKAAGLG